MPDTPPEGLPVPCAIDSIMLVGWVCVPDGEGTKWVPHLQPLSEIIGAGSDAVRVGKAPCGGGCAKKALLELAAKGGWKPRDVIAALEALK